MSLPKLYEQIGIEPPRVLDYYGVSTENLPTELPKEASLEGKTEYHYRWNLETGTRPGDALALCFICNTLLEEEVPNTNRMLDLLVSTGIEFRTRNLRGRYKSTNFIEEVSNYVGTPAKFNRNLMQGLRFSGVTAVNQGVLSKTHFFNTVENFMQDNALLPKSQRLDLHFPDNPVSWYDSLYTKGRRVISSFVPYELDFFEKMLEVYGYQRLPFFQLVLEYYRSSRKISLTGENGLVFSQRDVNRVPVDDKTFQACLRLMLSDIPNGIFMHNLFDETPV
ncbi:hypothetical protein GW755_03555 [bacterium]|nr:hypothetical protein [bacterium]